LNSRIFRQSNIQVIPLNVRAGGHKMVLDAEVADDPEALQGWYQRLRTGAPVKTAPASADTVEKICEKILARGEDLLYIGFSSRLSNIYGGVKHVLAKLEKRYPERRICLFDSRAVSFGEGLLVMKAAQRQEAGATLTEVFEGLKDDRNCLHQYFTVEDIAPLAKSGRLKGRARLAGRFGRKPLLSVDEDGDIHIKASARSERGVLSAIARRVDKKMEDADEKTIFIAHTDCIDKAQRLSRRLRETVHPNEVLIHPLDPVIAAHVGVGALGVFFIGVPRKKRVY
jgi:DegV family protein with EDD domain